MRFCSYTSLRTAGITGLEIRAGWQATGGRLGWDFGRRLEMNGQLNKSKNNLTVMSFLVCWCDPPTPHRVSLEIPVGVDFLAAVGSNNNFFFKKSTAKSLGIK